MRILNCGDCKHFKEGEPLGSPTINYGTCKAIPHWVVGDAVKMNGVFSDRPRTGCPCFYADKDKMKKNDAQQGSPK